MFKITARKVKFYHPKISFGQNYYLVENNVFRFNNIHIFNNIYLK